MNKLTLTTIAVLIYTAGFSQSFDSPEAPAGDPATALTQIADRYVEETIKIRPFLVYIFLSEFYEPDHASMPDRSPEALNAFEKIEDETLEALMQIDLATLTERGDWVTWHTLKEKVEADIGLRICRQELWNLNHLHGWQNLLSLLPARQPVETEQNRADALNRWSKFPGFVAQDRASLETWPGHHLQIAMAHGINGLHPVTRLARSAAYTEGWARYAEALAEEAGIYKNG